MWDNESGKVADIEENDGEMGNVTFHNLQPAALVSQDECDAVTLQAKSKQIPRNTALHKMCGHRKREQSRDQHLCPLAKLLRRILSKFLRTRSFY
ncbi:hypothetical protein PoB_007333600 [Plakobranchus ocellatus]|uniref:Uncharacterized protein n=1 Tax=Plakobranchus ocellatus TaxID=259542 RepID=A0AAV4DSM9_9GAST|nr:hypothetical protein PoB_007333600 [Plakobranchus ocellatus]